MDFERLAAGKGLALLRTPVGVGLAPLHDGKVLDRDQVAALPEEERGGSPRPAASSRRSWVSWSSAVPGLGARDPDGDPRDGRGGGAARGGPPHRRGPRRPRGPRRRSWSTSPRSRRTSSPTPRSSSRPPSRGSCRRCWRRASRTGRCSAATASTCWSTTRDSSGAPVVFEDLPTQPNLLGRVEHTRAARRAGHRLHADPARRAAPRQRRLPRAGRAQAAHPAVRVGGAQARAAGGRDPDRVARVTGWGCPRCRSSRSRSRSTRRSCSWATGPSTTCSRSWTRTSSSCSRCRSTSRTRSRARPTRRQRYGRLLGTIAARSGLRPLERRRGGGDRGRVRPGSPATRSGCRRTCAGSRTCSARPTTGRPRRGGTS